MRSCMSAAFDWTERALKQPIIIESLRIEDEPEAAGCLTVTVESDGSGFDSTPASSSKNPTATEEAHLNSWGRYGRQIFNDSIRQ